MTAKELEKIKHRPYIVTNRSILESCLELPEPDKYMMLNLIAEYSLYATMPDVEMTQPMKIVWPLMKAELDKSHTKFLNGKGNKGKNQVNESEPKDLQY